jgi:hypothetical protein
VHSMPWWGYLTHQQTDWWKQKYHESQTIQSLPGTTSWKVTASKLCGIWTVLLGSISLFNIMITCRSLSQHNCLLEILRCNRRLGPLALHIGLGKRQNQIGELVWTYWGSQCFPVGCLKQTKGEGVCMYWFSRNHSPPVCKTWVYLQE